MNIAKLTELQDILRFTAITFYLGDNEKVNSIKNAFPYDPNDDSYNCQTTHELADKLLELANDDDIFPSEYE